MVAYVARSERGPAVAEGFFAKDAFRYDAAQNCYTCPGNQRLSPFGRSEKNGHRTIRYGNRQACRSCSLKPQCASGTWRSIDRWEGEAVLDRMAERLAARPHILERRRETVEHPFGSIKQWMNQSAFLTRGLASVNAEFSLTALAYNLKRAINIVGIPAMIRAIHA